MRVSSACPPALVVPIDYQPHIWQVTPYRCEQAVLVDPEESRSVARLHANGLSSPVPGSAAIARSVLPTLGKGQAVHINRLVLEFVMHADPKLLHFRAT